MTYRRYETKYKSYITHSQEGNEPYGKPADIYSFYRTMSAVVTGDPDGETDVPADHGPLWVREAVLKTSGASPAGRRSADFLQRFFEQAVSSEETGIGPTQSPEVAEPGP